MGCASKKPHRKSIFRFKKSFLAASVAALSLLFQFPAHYQPASAKSKEKNTQGAAQDNLDIGLKRYKSGDIDGAIDSLLQATYFARNNYNPTAYFWLGECYKIKKDYGKAIEAFKQHISQVIGPTPEAHIELGYCLMDTDHIDEARMELYTALGQYMGPGPRAHNALGKLWEKQGRYRDALEQYRDALGQPPWTYLEAWMNYADCFVKLKDYGSAYLQYQQMLDADKVRESKDDDQKIYNAMGVCLLAKGDHEGAMRKWKECLSINPANPTAHLNLAMLFDSESHITSAINEYKQFVRLAPTDDKVANVKDRIEALQQKIAPPEPISSSKPTPYMRKQSEDAEAAKRRAFDELNAPPPSTENPF
jgi:tetratricopeptide (TPR) repeat protein